MGTYIIDGEEVLQFCCDQDVIYDPKHQIFIWIRQAHEDSDGDNYFRLSVSRDTIHWLYYDVRPTNFNPAWKKQQLDFPQLALTNDYLYLTSNMGGRDGSSKAIMSQVSLESLAAGVPIDIRYSYYDTGFDTKRTVTPVQGASNIMFFGTHLTNERMRIYRWIESSDQLKIFDQDIDPWLPSGMQDSGRKYQYECRTIRKYPYRI
jgi:hypothetical protein